jgi:hypothetical protein
MNKILKDATVDWETMRASIEKVREIMALPVGPGFIQQARNIIARIDFDLNTKIHDLNQPAKTGPAGAGKPGGTTELTDTARKFAELLHQRDAEIAKLAALNGAYRESATTLALLGVQYDAQAKKAEDAQGHTQREIAALNARTDALTRQKVAQILLNSALERERQLQAARDQNTGAIEAALHARDRAGLSGPDAEIQAIRDRATEDAAERRAHDAKQGLRADEQATEDARFRERIANIKAVSATEIDAIKIARQAATDLSISTALRDTDAQTRAIQAMSAAELEGGKAAEQMSVFLAGQDAVTRALNDATARGTTITDEQADAIRRSAEGMEQARINAEKLRAVFQEVSGAANQFFTDVFNRKNPGPALAEKIKRRSSPPLGRRSRARSPRRSEDPRHRRPPEDKQLKAAKDMNTAADKQLDAAQIMAGQSPMWAAGRLARRARAVLRSGSTGAQIAGVAGQGSAATALATASDSRPARGARRSRRRDHRCEDGRRVRSARHGGRRARWLRWRDLGAGDAAKEAAAKLEAARISFKNSWDAIIADINGDDLAKAVASADDRFQQLKQQFADSLSLQDLLHGKLSTGIDEINKVEAEYIAQLKQEAAAKARSTIESYKERELRAQGRNAEADDLHRKEERQQLIDSFGKEIDATERQILAAYDAADAAERNTAAVNALTTSVRGGPSGFKLNGYIQQYATGAPYPSAPPLGWPTLPPSGFSPPSSPQFSQSGTGKVATAPVVLNNPVFQFPNITDGKAAAKAFLAELDKTVAASGGLNTTRAVALNKMTVS